MNQDWDWEPTQSNGNIVVSNAHLAYDNKEQASQTWSIEINGGRVSRISPSSPNVRSISEVVDAQGGLMLPSFCHSHIHLDKCFILDKCEGLVQGDFQEAMKVTKNAKSEFPQQLEDLYARGVRIIKESAAYGVTAMRAHVEVDTSVGFSCLDVAQKLQHKYRALCDVHIAIFAQEPLFDSVDHQKPGKNFSLLEEAAQRHGVSVVGSAPYVEPTVEQAKKNIGLIFNIADARGVDQVDFHLDYNLDPNSEPLIYEVILQVKTRYKRGFSSILEPESRSSNSGANPPISSKSDASISHAKRPCPRITIGHATRLQLFSAEKWRELATAISDLPIMFVSLPQSDMYMQGRVHRDEPLGAPRGTLRVPYIAEKHGIEIAMSVNNVENAFTPQGSLDPLSLCAFGVGVFQAATPADIRNLAVRRPYVRYVLIVVFIFCTPAIASCPRSRAIQILHPIFVLNSGYPEVLTSLIQRSVTLTSKHAIGQTDIPLDLAPAVGDTADFIILHGRESLQSAVLNPCFDRTTIKSGRVVACRRSLRWFAS